KRHDETDRMIGKALRAGDAGEAQAERKCKHCGGEMEGDLTHAVIPPVQFGLSSGNCILAALAISAFRKSENSAGEVAVGSMPTVRMRRTTSGSLSAVTTAALSFATISGGVPPGAAMPNQLVMSNPFRPSSSKLGTLGNTENRFSDDTAIALSLPCSI